MTKWILIFIVIPFSSLMFMEHNASISDTEPTELASQEFPQLESWTVMAYVHAEDASGTVPLHFTLISDKPMKLNPGATPTENQMEELMKPQLENLKKSISFTVTGVYYYSIKTPPSEYN